MKSIGDILRDLFNIPEQLYKISAQLEQHRRMLTIILRREVKEGMDLENLKTNIEGLTAEVTATKDLQESAVIAINGLAAQQEALSVQLAEAIAANNPAGIQAASDAIAAQTQILRDSAAALAAAIPANTTP
jgi:hypothetical protein